MSDRIVLRGVTARGRHGVLHWEQALGQPFVVDAELTLDVSAAAIADDLTLTANYAEVAERIVARIEGEPVQLIETLADRIARDLLAATPAHEVTVTVHKPEAPIGVRFQDVAVTVTRSIDA